MLNKCLEPLTAIGCALGGFALGGVAPGVLLGGAALTARLAEARQRHGLDSDALFERMRLAVIRDWGGDPDLDEAARDAIGAASTAMGAHLTDSLPPRDQVAGAAASGAAGFPAAVAALIVDRLARVDAECQALFAAPAAGAEASLSRRFALTAIEAAVRAAKDDPAYAPLLTLDVVLDVAGGVGRIERGQAAQHDLLQQILVAVRPEAHQRAVSDEALIELARRITDKVDDADQALDALRRAIDEFIRLRESAARGTNLGDLVDETLRRIAAANERGAFDEGADAGAQAFAAWQEQQEAARQAGLRLVEANIEQHRLRFDAEATAHWICERLKIEGGGALDFHALRGMQHEWYEQGLVRGLRFELDVSIALARRGIAIARNATAWAAGQNDLAVALSVGGERIGGAAGLALLAEAVSAYRAALTVRTEAAMPVQWSTTQNNLGNALRTQGERTGGEAGLGLLADAVSAYRAALTVRTEAAMPVQWSMTQNNLGTALSTQGEWTGGEAGLGLLAEAVSAYRAALTVRTEAAMPVQWATTQNNLGTALHTQGERTGGEAGLELLTEAVSAYRAALTVYTEAAMPVDWAMTQNNLGTALCTQGERTGGEAGLGLLAEAVSAYRAALTVYTEAAMPVDWAMTQNNLGAALQRQGERTGDETGLELLTEAVSAYRAALTVYTEAAMPVDWAMTQNNLGNALRAQGVRTEDLALLGDAASAYRAALTVLTAEHFSHHHEITSRNLARVEARIAERGG